MAGIDGGGPWAAALCRMAAKDYEGDDSGMGEIKSREKIKDIKVFDRAANVSANMRESFVKSKDAAHAAGRQAEQTQDAGYHSPADYATDKMAGGAKKTGALAADAVRKNPIKQAAASMDKARYNFKEAGRQLGNARNAMKRPDTAASKSITQTQGAYPRGTTQYPAADTASPQTVRPITQAPRYPSAANPPADGAKKLMVKRAGEKARRTASRTRQAAGRSVKAADAPQRTIKQAARESQRSVKTVSKTAGGMAKPAQKGLKTAEHTAKVTVKTAQQAAQAAGKAAAAAKRAAQITRTAAKAAIHAAKAAVKATAAMVKAAILALKGLVSIIMAGGWVAVAVILVICLIGLLVGSVFGIFFSGEDSGSGRTMPAVVSQLTVDFYSKIEEIKRDNPHDVAIMDAMAINWRDVLAVYAVKISTDQNGGMDVATLDDTRVELLRGVLEDMVSLSYNVNTQTQERIVLDEEGEETTEEVEVIVLTIHMEQKSADEAAASYGFSQTRQDQLHELLAPAYDELWTALIGSVFSPGVGGGEILAGYTGFAPTGIFSWPLVAGYPVNSSFGWRPDPFDPSKTVFHGGADMACPQGTPILAAASGTVIIANATDSWGGTYGYYVKLQHDSTFSTLYAHCSSITVASGQQVQKGQVIGYVGSTGNSSGNHLHFEVIAGGTRVDPQAFFG